MVVDPALAAAPGLTRIVEELGKSSTVVEVEPAGEQPNDLTNVDRLVGRWAATPPDALVAVGGGRELDAVKAVRLRLADPSLVLTDLPPILDLPNAPAPQVVAVPTTSGSGADASWSADLWSADGGPLEVAHRALVPEWSLLDPSLAARLPPAVVVDGGLESLTLAAEAYLSAWSNPLSDGLALDAVATVTERLAHAVRWSDDPDARAALHYAASAAGLAASNAQRGLAHALARALEPSSGLSYGRLLGLLLPPVLDFAHPSARDRLERLADRARARDDRSDQSLAQRLRRLYPQLPFPLTIRAAGGHADRVDAARASVVARTLRSPGALANPRVPTAADVDAILTVALG